MITIKNRLAREKMATAGAFLAELFIELTHSIMPDSTTEQIDAIIANYLSSKKMVSQSKGYMGYRHVSCISINDEVVHGVPSTATLLKEGDLVKVDVCAAWQGYCADMARCFFVGSAPQDAEKLVTTAYASLDKGIAQAYPGKKIGDISAAIQQEVEAHGFGVVRDFAGHGIGQKMHEEPEVLNYGVSGKGPLLREGMALAIEPMITQGHYAVCVMADGWTAKTVDGRLAAHVEDTVIITEQGPQIITRLA